MTTADARQILRTCERTRHGMLKTVRSTWTVRDADEHNEKMMRLFEAEEQAKKVIAEADRPSSQRG
jgi:hypothetical protein